MSGSPPNFYTSKVKIGEGSFGEVYKATIEPGRVVAVKELKHKFRDRETLGSEFEAYKRLGKHPNIVCCYDYILPVEKRRPPALIMEYCDEGTLSDYVIKHPGLNTVEILALLEQIANGVYFLHRQRILHRDLKTENVFLTSSPNGETNCKIADFGIAKVYDMNFMLDTVYTQKICGTYYFMAPEVWKKIYSSKSDIFSFGAIALASLTRTFVGKKHEILAPFFKTNEAKQSIGKAYNFNADVASWLREQMTGLSDEIQNIVIRMLSEYRADRPSSEECYIEIRALHLALRMFQKAMDDVLRHTLSPHPPADRGRQGALSEDTRIRSSNAGDGDRETFHHRHSSSGKHKADGGYENVQAESNSSNISGQRRKSRSSTGASKQSFEDSSSPYEWMSSEFDDLDISDSHGYINQKPETSSSKSANRKKHR